MKLFWSRIFRLTPYVMLGLLIAYVALHSPMRGVIASRLGLESSQCYLCAVKPGTTSTADFVTASVLLLAAVVAGFIVADRFGGTGYEKPLIFCTRVVA